MGCLLSSLVPLKMLNISVIVGFRLPLIPKFCFSFEVVFDLLTTEKSESVMYLR